MGCATFSANVSNTNNQDFHDFETITSTVTVNTAGNSLWKVMVTTDIIHPFPGDLNITLTSPAGTRVSLSTHNGLHLQDFHGTIWRDDAGESNPPGPVTLASFAGNPVLTAVAPEEPLGAFLGEDANGVWTLNVEDTDTGDDTGTLENWGLSVVALNDFWDSVQSTFTDSTVRGIPDNGTPVNIPFTMPELYASLSELELVTDLPHAESDDLVIELVPPTGVTITIASHDGGPSKNVIFGTHWLDNAGATNPPGAVTDSTFVTETLASPLAPQEPLSAATDYLPGGQWHLRVQDTDNNGKVGTLNSFTLNTASLICRPSLSASILPAIPRAAGAADPIGVHGQEQWCDDDGAHGADRHLAHQRQLPLRRRDRLGVRRGGGGRDGRHAIVQPGRPAVLERAPNRYGPARLAGGADTAEQRDPDGDDPRRPYPSSYKPEPERGRRFGQPGAVGRGGPAALSHWRRCGRRQRRRERRRPGRV